jgi:hypothetical protein
MTLEEQLEIVGSKIKAAIAAIDRIRLDTQTRDVIAAELGFVRRILVEAKRQPTKLGTAVPKGNIINGLTFHKMTR